ncbi:MAG: choice-of-anchor Q domain-containing protein [Deltaproteobacteria bacterium]
MLAKSVPQYKYIHLLGGIYTLNGATLEIGSAAYIDGSNTLIGFGGNSPLIHFSFALGGGVLSNVSLSPGTNSPEPSILIDGGGQLRIFNSTIKKGIKITAGSLTISKSTFQERNDIDVGIDCSAGAMVSVTGSTFTPSIVNSTGCNLTLERNRFEVVTGPCFGAYGGTAMIENNVFTGSTQLDDCGGFSNLSAGSTVRFNTFVNTSDVVADGSPLHCDHTATVTSNVFAWGSTAPNTGGCTPTYSLYDSANTEPLGMGSFKGDVTTFFADKAAKNFHLAAHSPAIGKAESGTGVTSDFDGVSRPASGPDIGAFEGH